MAWAKNTDLTATVLFGTFVNGVATFGNGAATDLQCMITNFEDSDETKMYDGSTLCDATEINDPGRSSGTVTFDARVPADAPRVFKGKNGLPVKMVIAENDSVETPDPVYGIVGSVRLTVANDALQQEAVSISKNIRLAS